VNNVTRSIRRSINRDWRYRWKITVRADRVRYTAVSCPGGRWENEWGIVEPDPDRPKTHTKLTLKSGYSYDGCSVVPDAPGTEDASGFHDLVYQFMEAIACQWNKRLSVVRSFADHVFSDLMRQDKCPVRGLYFTGVRLFGGAFHWIAKQFTSDEPKKPKWRGMALA